MLLSDLIKEKMTSRKLTLQNIMMLTDLPAEKIKKALDGGLLTGKEEAMLCDGLKIDPDDITFDEYSISVSDAAKAMQIAPETLRCAMKNNRFPVGCWLGGRSFHIPAKAFWNYMGLRSQSHLASDVTMLAMTLVEEISEHRKRK